MSHVTYIAVAIVTQPGKYPEFLREFIYSSKTKVRAERVAISNMLHQIFLQEKSWIGLFL